MDIVVKISALIQIVVAIVGFVGSVFNMVRAYVEFSEIGLSAMFAFMALLSVSLLKLSIKELKGEKR